MAAALILNFPIKRIAIPFHGPRGKKSLGYLQLPKGSKKPPLVVFCGGIDGWKRGKDQGDPFFIAERLATFSMIFLEPEKAPLSFPEGDKVFSRH